MAHRKHVPCHVTGRDTRISCKDCCNSYTPRQHTGELQMDRSTPYYPTDLTDCQWELIRPRIPDSRPIGADRMTSMRSVVNAILYRTRCGCPWRMLPRDFPHWRTIYGYFHQWQNDGTWETIRASLKTVRCQANRRRNAA